ncbi:MAG: hypothetical protein N2Z76_04415 [Treponemataceae bacterium]|nr:hypothetical protein [Treponemataceae bacterium]
MNQGDLLFMFFRMVFVTITAFWALLAWTKRRDWVCLFFMVGSFFSYLENLYILLIRIGILEGGPALYGSVPIVELVLSNLPQVFYSIALCSIVIRKTK